jgi:periplasmic divalent cation tolerance protein
MYIVVFITCANKKEAKDIASGLIKNRLAACVNITGDLESFFWWRGKTDYAREILLIIKSKKQKLSRIIKLVKSMHSYTVPEIIAIPVIAGNESYLKWIDDSLG